MQGLAGDETYESGTLVLRIDIDNKTTDLRHEPLNQTEGDEKSPGGTGGSGNPVP